MTLAYTPHDSRIRPRRRASATMRRVRSASGRARSPSVNSSMAIIAPGPRMSPIALWRSAICFRPAFRRSPTAWLRASRLSFSKVSITASAAAQASGLPE